MTIARTEADLRRLLEPWRAAQTPWAFVPTMGALHEGHLTLCRRAAADFPRVIASVFVNPTQFDRAEDLARYPRQPEADAEALRTADVDALFLPSESVVYPRGRVDDRGLPDLGGLDRRYEGGHRPGHFAGVVQVVRRLLALVQPAAMYMGEKDAQQLAVLRRAAEAEGWPVEIVGVPIVREASGLAMSSRNGRLDAATRQTAAGLYAELSTAAAAWRQGADVRHVVAAAKTRLADLGFAVEYFDLVDPARFEGLAPETRRTHSGPEALIVAAAWLGGVRLIDNLPVP